MISASLACHCTNIINMIRETTSFICGEDAGWHATERKTFQWVNYRNELTKVGRQDKGANDRTEGAR